MKRCLILLACFVLGLCALSCGKSEDGEGAAIRPTTSIQPSADDDGDEDTVDVDDVDDNGSVPGGGDSGDTLPPQPPSPPDDGGEGTQEDTAAFMPVR